MMESPLLQRIVGAAVLVALGVIFIPVLLDGSGYRSRQLHSVQFKPKPSFPPLSQKQLPLIKSPLKTARNDQLKKQVRKKAAGKIVKKSDRASRALRAFALQVGTFENNANAKKLRDKLRKAGYASFVVPAVRKNKKIYQVRIGPELERNTLEKIKKKIKKRYKIEGYVVNQS